jgi:hypothetical protein
VVQRHRKKTQAAAANVDFNYFCRKRRDGKLLQQAFAGVISCTLERTHTLKESMYYVSSVNKIRLKCHFHFYLYLFYIKYHNLNLTINSYKKGDVCTFSSNMYMIHNGS